MDSDLGSNLNSLLTCSCGRIFGQLNALSNHRRSCGKAKKRLSDALSAAKEAFQTRKRQRLSLGSYLPVVEPGLRPSGSLVPDEPGSGSTLLETSAPSLDPGHDSLNAEDLEQPIAARKGKRTKKLPKRFQDELPPHNPAILHSISPAKGPETQAQPRLTQSMPHEGPSHSVSTRYDIFGLHRKYLGSDPSISRVHWQDSEDSVTMDDLWDGPKLTQVPLSQELQTSAFHPYPNQNSFLLGNWFWNTGGQMSHQNFKHLLDIIGDPAFKPDDVRHTSWNRINRTLGSIEESGEEWENEGAGWYKSEVVISVPFPTKSSDPGPHNYTIQGFYHRSLVHVIKERVTCDKGHYTRFCYNPFEIHWQPNEAVEAKRVYGELYTSPAFAKAHQDIQQSSMEPGCSLPRVVIALMLWSDATQLTSFGQAKLWPLYLFFGNDSKYLRSKPTCHMCSHMAYFVKLPDEFQDFVAELMGRKPTPAFLAHCQRELMHAQWEILLDDEFLNVYIHGMVIDCGDGQRRRCYPRIFTYSADYPEKILLAGIRNLGGFPCPRCLIPLNRVHNVGMRLDMKQRKTKARVDNAQREKLIQDAREKIYEEHRPVTSLVANDPLKGQSLVPTINMFSKRLRDKGFNMFSMFVVDLMHEFELGVWKALFIHLIRILESIDTGLVCEMDRRYRQLPTFGRDVIRRFSANSSEMKKMTAHGYENLLQCSIPVFEDLLPEPHNSSVLELLFAMAHWHGLAKLRLHTDDTLELLDKATITLGEQLRHFQRVTCPKFQTKETRREAEARRRRANKQKSKAKSHNSSSKSQTNNSQRPKTFNLNTYKVHALGDYADTIRQYGTTDSFTTETGELEHRTPKSRYTRTSRKFFVKQMAQIERRQARLRNMRSTLTSSAALSVAQPDVVALDPQSHHNIGKSENEPEHIGTFLNTNRGDPAIVNFLPKLKAHLLPRVKAALENEAHPENHDLDTPGIALGSTQTANLPLTLTETKEVDSDKLYFKNDRIYRHKLIRINHTTYDIRRADHVVNPRTSHSCVMVLAGHSEHPECQPKDPFWYARVLGIYHANVIYTGPGMKDYKPRTFQFLWVRWFQNVDPIEWDSQCLQSVVFPPTASEDAFGFLDPADILRGCHILPKLASGMVHLDGIGLSKLANDKQDWRMYYINRFVDRDMLMRCYWGMGVGHTYAHPQVTEPSSVVSAVVDPRIDEDEDEACIEGDTAGPDRPGESSCVEGDDDENLSELELGDREMGSWDMDTSASDSSEGGGEESEAEEEENLEENVW